MEGRKRIAIDMDEVLAKYTEKVIRTLYDETGFKIELKHVEGAFLSKSVPPEHLERVTSFPYREGFFRDLEVMDHAREVLRQLQEEYDIFIVSATMQHANAPKSKLEWLQEHFPFIHFKNIVFCGDKSIIRADFLIDDHPRHLENFTGTSLLFEAFHNIHEKRFPRMRNWLDVADYFQGI
jgi:5'(3')-deoxyribonucleotidase